MKFHYWLVALAIACNGSDSDKTGATGDSTATGDDDDVTGTDCAPDGPYTGPVTITTASVTCAGDQATFAMETQGVAGAAGGWIFSQETASTYAGGQWADNHTLASYEFDATCGTYDKLNRTITAGVEFGTDAADQSSIFSCDQYEDNAYMTFAFGVADSTGNLADCFAFGHDPAGMSAGSYDISGQDPDFDISACRAGTEGV